MPDLAEIAAAEYARRLASARRKVAQDKLAPHEANALLRPWLALACRMGADYPEYEDALAELRVVPADVPAGRVAYDDEALGSVRAFFSDGQTRAVVADDICPRAQVAATVAAARDAALDRAAEAQGLDVERNDRAASLTALAIAIGARPTGRRRR